jgi:hypothetical protein
VRGFNVTYVHVALNDGDSIAGPELQHTQLVQVVVVRDAHDVVLCQARKATQCILQSARVVKESEHRKR